MGKKKSQLFQLKPGLYAKKKKKRQAKTQNIPPKPIGYIFNNTSLI